MNASEPDPQAEETNADTASGDSISEALLRAKARQKKLYVIASMLLVSGAFFILGMISFSNGTAIKVRPEEAQETAVLSMVEGVGITMGYTVYSLSENPTIKVSATGFRPLRKTLQASESGGTVRLELVELPGQLRISTRPSSDNTRWIVDGQMAVVARALKQDVFAGKHVVEIDSPYYRKKNIPITMERGKPLEIAVDLQDISGQLNIRSVPAGASVRINGDLAGVSPLSLGRAGGKYHLEVVDGDYQTVSEDVEITNAEKVIERNYHLALKDAYLHVHISPLGGTLLLNGKEVSSTDPLTIKALVKNSLVYAKDGYFSQHRTISAAPGSEKNMSLHLKPEAGKVSLFSTPNAMVNVDGKDVGQTPIVMTLSAVPHRIELRKKGYRVYRKTVIPSSKSAQEIKVALRTERQAILTETAETYRNSVGIELKLFRPNGMFIMGAPRYEKGQRANEFLRTVKLTRPFYISTHEVTRTQYARYRRKKGTGRKKGDSLLSSGRKSETVPFLRPSLRQPVTSISWIEAARYCNWLSQQEKVTPFYDIRNDRLLGSNVASVGYRLPSEAEWEWLAREAGKSRESRFTWGDDTTIPPKSGNIADEYAKGKTPYYVPNYSDGHAGVAPVGSYPPEKSGLYDLTGNVSEWMHDVYSLIPPDGQQTEIDPLGEKRGDTHTVKGSNWRSGTITELRASYREGEKVGRDDIGFRIARYVY